MTTTIDPVAGLVSYVEEIKPYHTKVVEVLVEYVHTDCIDVTFSEDFELSLGVPANPAAWGWSEAEASRMFNDNWSNYQVSGSGNTSGNWWDIDGDFVADFSAGTEFLVKTDDGFAEYTVSSSVKIPTTVNGVTVNTTRISVVETVPTVKTSGAIFHREAYSYDVDTNTYTLKAGLVFPSPIGVAKNADCTGFGSYFEHILASGALVPNAILNSNSSLNYFEISNVLSPPIAGANTWADVLRYGVKVVIGGTSQDGEYTVFLSAPSGGSPDILRVYVLENLTVTAGAVGTLTVRTWGYDEPDVCAGQGQSLVASAHINESLQFTVNDIEYNGLAGWDMDHWGINGYDGGPIVITVA